MCIVVHSEYGDDFQISQSKCFGIGWQLRNRSVTQHLDARKMKGSCVHTHKNTTTFFKRTLHLSHVSMEYFTFVMTRMEASFLFLLLSLQFWAWARRAIADELSFERAHNKLATQTIALNYNITQLSHGPKNTMAKLSDDTFDRIQLRTKNGFRNSYPFEFFSACVHEAVKLLTCWV